MHAQFLGNPANRPDAELVLAPDLFKQLHFPSPVQRVPPLWAAPKSEYPSACLGELPRSGNCFAAISPIGGTTEGDQRIWTRSREPADPGPPSHGQSAGW